MARPAQRSRLIVEALVLFGALMLVEVSWLAGLSEPFDLLIHDRVLRYAPAAQREPAVAIVVIDDEALNQLGWPVPDRHLAAAINPSRQTGMNGHAFDRCSIVLPLSVVGSRHSGNLGLESFMANHAASRISMPQH